MNSHIYRQYDNRWRWLPYPSGGYYLNGSGCGCCAVTHCIIEIDKYKNWTPANVQPYMKQYAIRGNGTSWNGILKSLQHYGLKDVANIPTMPQLWRELEKGNKVGVLLFGNTKGPDGTVWTTGGHYIAFTGYRVKNGQHQLYLKDSGGRKHDGWYSYERSMRGDVRQVWIGTIPKGSNVAGAPTVTTSVSTSKPSGKLSIDGQGGPATVKALQQFLNVYADGVISGQNKSLHKYYASITSVKYGTGGSATVKALQKWIGIEADGIWGRGTSQALQRKLGLPADGRFGPNSVKALQKFLNKNSVKKETPKPATPKPVTPIVVPTSTPKNFKETVIDISYVQSKSIDWAKVKAAGIAGAIIRCGFRGYGSGALNEDSMFMNHITGANKVGLKLGIYFFTEAINAAEGKAEAQFALKMLKKAGVKLSYPIAIDTEDIKAKNPVPRANSSKLSTAKRTEAIKAFCEEIKANGYEPMIYASTAWLNNQLDMSKLPYTVWVAQYNDKVTYTGKYSLWQYTSTGKVDGINQVVDKSYCYVNYSPKAIVAQPTTTVVTKPKEEAPVNLEPQLVVTKPYSGTLPTMSIKKTTAQVIADTITWSKWIAGNNSFHYGHGKAAHHNGCYFCGTNTTSGGRSKKGIVDYQKSYCCNPFVGAAWAHGGGDSTALALCQKGSSWDFSKGKGYDASSLFKNLGHPKKSDLKPGDVLCRNTHVALYIGNGCIAEAGSEDDNVRNSAKWNNSIRVKTLTDANYKKFLRVHRYVGSVDTTRVIRYGEISVRVKDLQKYLNWYFGKEVCTVDGIFGDGTLKHVKAFQTARKLVVDGIVGANTIAEMGKVKK